MTATRMYHRPSSANWAPTLIGLIVAIASLQSTIVLAQEAQWIWYPSHRQSAVPAGSCYFRRTFQLDAKPEEAQLMIAADDQYEVYINGRKIGNGSSTRQLDEYVVTDYFARGRNAVAIKATNTNGGTAAVAARVMLKQRSRGWISYSTNANWKSELRPLPLWALAVYNDSRWVAAKSYGSLGRTPPWDREADVAAADQGRHKRFKIAKDFDVQRIIWHDEADSIIAMSFDEFGRILAARENGPLLLIADSNKDGTPDKAHVYCDKVKNCQGILALSGNVYVTADGPQGAALYRLRDRNRDGLLEDVSAIVKFEGKPSEHGAHGLTLGPDGRIYCVVGNHSAPKGIYHADSPMKNFYEGDLVQPRYEDPAGHASGVRAPGGVVFRTDVEGKKVELIAGGLRNAYDLAFNRDGELFTYDSDMESDIGTTWYRPTRLYHVAPGSEFGWRSGWAKWPDYYVDVLPPTLETGRGSPTGVVFYDHLHFPAAYRGALFMADWSEGRILAVRLKQDGAGYTADSEVFLEGKPLNVTDVAVGPDGALYFSTGGRGTDGGIYRVRYTGRIPASLTNIGEGLSAVIRQPQFQSAWSRQNIAKLKQTLGAGWNRGVQGVALTSQNPPEYRTHALDLLTLYGPRPTKEMLLRLAEDKNERVRAKAAGMLGKYKGADVSERLNALLNDEDRMVRRRALEAIADAKIDASAERVVELSGSEDRYEAWAARRVLERMDVAKWKPIVLQTDNQRAFNRSAAALMISYPTKPNAQAVLARTQAHMKGFVSDRNFIDMLRVIQLALHRTELTPQDRRRHQQATCGGISRRRRRDESRTNASARLPRRIGAGGTLHRLPGIKPTGRRTRERRAAPAFHQERLDRRPT